MNVSLTVFVAALCWSIELLWQTQPSAKIPFSGCYEIVFQTWHPGNEDASPLPSRFQLRSDQADNQAPIFSRCGASRQITMTGRNFGYGDPKEIDSGYLGEEEWADLVEP